MREMSICSTYPTYCGHMGVPNHRDTGVVADLFPAPMFRVGTYPLANLCSARNIGAAAQTFWCHSEFVPPADLFWGEYTR